MAKERVLVKTPEGRVSFPSVFEKTSFGGGNPAYEVTVLIPKETNIDVLKTAAGNAAIAEWGEKLEKLNGAKLQNPIKDGDGFKTNGLPYPDEYKGHWHVKCKAYRNRPGIVNKIGGGIITSEEEFYAGCWAILSVTPEAYGGPGKDYNPGVTFYLNNILKTRDDEPFSGRTSADDDFAEDCEAADPAEATSDVQTGEKANDIFA